MRVPLLYNTTGVQVPQGVGLATAGGVTTAASVALIVTAASLMIAAISHTRTVPLRDGVDPLDCTVLAIPQVHVTIASHYSIFITV